MLVVIIMLMGYMLLNALSPEYGRGFFGACIFVWLGAMLAPKYAVKYWGVVILGLAIGGFYFFSHVVGVVLGLWLCLLLSFLFSEK